MNDWACAITKTGNGFILEKQETNDEGAVTYTKEVFESKDEDDDPECLRRLFYGVLDYFGIYYGKHSPKKLRFVIEEKNNDGDFVEVEN